MKLTLLGFLTISCQIEIDNSLHAYNLGLPSTVCRNGSYGIFKKKTKSGGLKDNGGAKKIVGCELCSIGYTSNATEHPRVQ